MNGPISPVRSRAARLGYRVLGLGAVALAALGVALPGLPTTPFLLVALWAFTRGAPGWADRLRRHPRFGGALLAWEARRAIPRPAKTAAVLGATGSFAAFAATANSFAASAGLGLVFAAVLAFVLTRPSV
jgi:hypothetical protein